MFTKVSSHRALLFAALFCGSAWAQGSNPSSPTQPQVPQTSSPSAPQKENVDSVTPRGPKESGILRSLPEGLEPNPPNKADLDADHLTWKGEYEATKDGKPVLGPDARPIPVLYNKKGKRVKSRTKALKTHPLTVSNGTMTVDGWTGKARLNYDIPEQSFLYFSTPGMGTIVVSQAPFPGAKEQKEAFAGKTLTIHVDDHEVQLASEKELAGKKPESAWVLLDPVFRVDQRYPVMGFGPVTHAPYAWPAAKNVHEAGVAAAPPLPSSMLQQAAVPICITQPGKACPASAQPQSNTANAPAGGIEPGTGADPANASKSSTQSTPVK